MKKKRIDLVDALRGFAIIGILLLHSIEHFCYSVYPDGQGQSELMLSLNKGTWDTLFFTFGSKAYGIFALLFGFTFYLQFNKQAKAGIDFGRRFMWRMLILFGFGWVNSILFPGEILLIYAMLSPSLFFIRKWKDKYVLIFALVFLFQPLEIYHVLATSFNPEFIIPNYNLGGYWQETFTYLKEGSFLSMMQNSYKGVLMTLAWSMGNGRLFQIVGLFALGLFFARKSLFDGSSNSFKTWLIILIVALAVYTPLLLIHSGLDANSSTHIGALKTLLVAWSNLMQLLIMVALFVILFSIRLFRIITRPLYNYGRMSLSNYMMQSLAGGLIFHSYAFNLSTNLNVFHSLLVGIVLVVGFVIFCNWWFRKHQQGPMEKLWHILTWIDRPFFKRKQILKRV